VTHPDNLLWQVKRCYSSDVHRLDESYPVIWDGVAIKQTLGEGVQKLPDPYQAIVANEYKTIEKFLKQKKYDRARDQIVQRVGQIMGLLADGSLPPPRTQEILDRVSLEE
jgi:hypothetical protein